MMKRILKIFTKKDNTRSNDKSNKKNIPSLKKEALAVRSWKLLHFSKYSTKL